LIADTTPFIENQIGVHSKDEARAVMVKRKSRAVLSVADGSGGMMTMTDRRFEPGDWPISFAIPIAEEQADRWSRYLRWMCLRRGWTSSALGQIDRAENSGTITITANGDPQLNIVWERRRGGPLQVKARVASASVVLLSEANEFFDEVNDACRLATTAPIYVRGTLQYDDGLAWRGELWLDRITRLAPPSLQDETASLGPRIIHIDAMLDCIGESDVMYARHQMLLEVSAFLSVVMRKAVRLPDQRRTWTVTPDMRSCEVRYLGYLERDNAVSMPVPGTVKEVPLYAPDDPPMGIGNDSEISVRSDIADLWNRYRGLSASQRLQFLQAAAKWQEAMINWQDRPSLSFALMAVSCEALKPANADDRQNCYDVIEALLGRTDVDRIRQNPFPAQQVRSTHLHSGEFHGSEFMMMDFMRTYEDPTFRAVHREMARITPAAIVEWLKRGGSLTLPIVERRRTVRRWARDNLAITTGLAFGFGLLIGCLVTNVVAASHFY
jgi:hypothetical protein